MAPRDASCPLCGGSGWRVLEDGERSRALRCDCYRAAEAARRIERTGVPAGLRHCTLEDFRAIDDGNLRLARQVAREFIDAWPLNRGTGILFHGPCGTGKTHLAVAIVLELAQTKSVRTLFLDFRELLKTIQESYNPISETSEKEVLRRVLEAELLVLDDLGAEKPSAWVRETVAYLINERYNAARPVVITTNLRMGSPPPRETKGQDFLEERVGVPTMSRLIEMCKIVSLEKAPDFRRTIKVHGTDKGFRLG